MVGATDEVVNSTPAHDAQQHQSEGQNGGNPGHTSGSTLPELTLRALITSKEAGIIIGRDGENVATIRINYGVKAGVSKVTEHVFDRVLTISGSVEGVAKAYKLIATHLLENDPPHPSGPSNDVTKKTIRFLISHTQMGIIIGRTGTKIKAIQSASGARMVARKELLPNSTERIIEILGTPEQMESAVQHVSQCLVEDTNRHSDTILYDPAARVQPTSPVGGTGANSMSSGRNYPRTGRGGDFTSPWGGNSPAGGNMNQQHRQGYQGGNRGGNRYSYNNNNNSSSGQASAQQAPATTHDNSHADSYTPANDVSNEDVETQNISIPPEMVGCIIGRGGSKISEIRKSSGARISIAKVPHDETGERMFTIMGSATANEKALYLLYENLEAEKSRRQDQQQQQQQHQQQQQQQQQSMQPLQSED